MILGVGHGKFYDNAKVIKAKGKQKNGDAIMIL